MEEVTADSGYCSEKNLLYLKEQNISSYIKLQDHERRKTRALSGRYWEVLQHENTECSRMSFIMSAMTEENFIISEQRQKNRLVTLKRLRCMDVLIAAAANIKQNVSINMMLKKMQRKIRS